MAFSKSLPKGQIPVDCQLCHGLDKIEWKCTDCNLLMCDRYKLGVHLKIAKNHRIVNIQNIGEHGDSWGSFVFDGLKCPDHPNQPCSLYCKTCSKVICLKCIIKVHNGHTFVDEEEFEEKKEEMKEGQKKAEGYLSVLGSAKIKIANPEETDCLELRSIRQNILDQKKKLHKAVDGYADNLVQDVDQYFRSLKQEEETKIDKEIKHVHEKNDTLGSIVSSMDFTKFFRDFDELNISMKNDMFQENMNMYSLPTFVPGEFRLKHFGYLEGILRKKLSKVELKVTNQWSTKLTDIHYIVVCPDGTLWIADNSKNLLQHITLEKHKVTILSGFSTVVYGLSVDINSNILVSIFKTKLIIIDGRTENVADSVFDIEPYISGHIHTTKDNKVLILAKTPWLKERNTVIVFDQAGNRLSEYEKDSNNKTLFSNPYRIASTSNGNICIVDTLHRDFRGRIVVIDQAGCIKGIYTGHHGVNTEDKPFKPIYMHVTQSDTILIVDWEISVIHILNRDGKFISFYKLSNIGIQYPHSLAQSTSGHLYIGCGKFGDGQENFRAKLYEVEYTEN